MGKFAIILTYLLVLASATTAEEQVIKTVARRDDVRQRGKRSDDVSLLALQAVVQQQAVSLQQLQSHVTALVTEIASVKNSLPSTFVPVAFTARYSHDDKNGIALTANSILKFDHVVTNKGNGYSPATGIFSASVAGTYSFYLKFMSVNNHGHTAVTIDKHGVELNFAFANGGANNDEGSVQVAVYLNAGEQVWARQRSGNAVRGGQYTVFTGFLIQAD